MPGLSTAPDGTPWPYLSTRLLRRGGAGSVQDGHVQGVDGELLQGVERGGGQVGALAGARPALQQQAGPVGGGLAQRRPGVGGTGRMGDCFNSRVGRKVQLNHNNNNNNNNNKTNQEWTKKNSLHLQNRAGQKRIFFGQQVRNK